MDLSQAQRQDVPPQDLSPRAGKPASNRQRAGIRGALKRRVLLVHLVRSARIAWQIVADGARQRRWTALRNRIIREYFGANPVRKLQIGSGPVLTKGWLNSDIRPRRRDQIFMDATKEFPFPDQSLDYILAEHVVQDLAYDETSQMLRECARVLRPRGRIRLSAPDLEKLCGLYEGRTGMEERYISWYVENHAKWAPAELPGFVINTIFREMRFVYDRRTIAYALRQEGFDEIAFFAPGESEDPALRGLELHGVVLGDQEINRFESFVVEAAKGTSRLLFWAIFIIC
jgi:predicted SAM-dependent methyltransferase